MSRQAKDKLVKNLLALSALLGCALLFLILFAVFWRGVPALGLDFLFTGPGKFGEGGILYQLLGTLLLTFGAGALCFPLALGTALFQTEILKPGRVNEMVSILLYSLNAVPTVLFGLIGFLVFGVWLGMGVSWFTGVLILSVMILPTVQTAVRQSMEAIPEHYQDTARALGLGFWQRVQAVVLPRSLPGLVTGVLIGLARAAGETAAIMFTATVFSGVLFPKSLSDPALTLQTHILTLAQEAVDPEAQAAAWGAALVLISLVFCLIGVSFLIRNRVSAEAEL